MNSINFRKEEVHNASIAQLVSFFIHLLLLCKALHPFCYRLLTRITYLVLFETVFLQSSSKASNQSSSKARLPFWRLFSYTRYVPSVVCRSTRCRFFHATSSICRAYWPFFRLLILPPKKGYAAAIFRMEFLWKQRNASNVPPHFHLASRWVTQLAGLFESERNPSNKRLDIAAAAAAAATGRALFKDQRRTE